MISLCSFNCRFLIARSGSFEPSSHAALELDDFRRLLAAIRQYLVWDVSANFRHTWPSLISPHFFALRLGPVGEYPKTFPLLKHSTPDASSSVQILGTMHYLLTVIWYFGETSTPTFVRQTCPIHMNATLSSNNLFIIFYNPLLYFLFLVLTLYFLSILLSVSI